MLSRRTLLASHRVLGLSLALLLMFQAGSGAALVFREELLVALNRQLLAASPSTATPAVDRILEEIDRRFGHPAIERVVFPRGERTAAMVYLRSGGVAGRRVIASDPVSGAVLGELGGIGLAPFVLFRIHDELLLGNAGHAVLLVEGLALLYMVGVGFLLGRPRHHGRLRVRWHSGKLVRRFDLHRTLGLSVAPLLVFSASTGAIMQADFLAAATNAPPPVRRPPVNWSVLMPHVSGVVQEYAREAIEDVRISDDGRTAKILAYTDEVARPLALDRVEIDLISGEARLVQRAAQESPGRQFLSWMYPLHTGKAFGAAGAFVALVTAAGLLCLPVLGFLLWRARPARKALRAERRAQVPS